MINKQKLNDLFENTHTILRFDDNKRLVGMVQFCKAKHLKRVR